MKRQNLQVLFFALVLLLAACKKPYLPAEKLTRCTVYRITENAPAFSRFLDEGDVAFYGLLLQADPRPELLAYLREKKRDHLWEYNWDYGVTAEDSAFVLEGMLAAGASAAELLPSAERLSREYFLPQSGGFRSVLNPRSKYWDQASLVSTARLAWLLQKIGGDRFSDQVKSAEKYLRAKQEPDGSWKGEWYPSRTLSVYYCLKFLAEKRPNHSEQISAATAFLQAAQLSDGSWNTSIIDTSAAVLALRLIEPNRFAQEILNARLWLSSALRKKNQGEPVLYYWFENSRDNSKEFFHCQDTGPITKAWAKLALRD